MLQKAFDPALVEFLGGVRVGTGGMALDVLASTTTRSSTPPAAPRTAGLGVHGQELAGS
jgi:ferredoxin--NADP+ reductase